MFRFFRQDHKSMRRRSASCPQLAGCESDAKDIHVPHGSEDNCLTEYSSDSETESEEVISASKHEKLWAQRSIRRIQKRENARKDNAGKNLISMDDYLGKLSELKMWLREERKKNVESMTSPKLKEYYRIFMKLWNKRKLPGKYYRSHSVNLAEGDEQSPNSQYHMVNSPTDQVSTCLLPSCLDHSVDGLQQTVDPAFSTFGKSSTEVLSSPAVLTKQMSETHQSISHTQISRPGNKTGQAPRSVQKFAMISRASPTSKLPGQPWIQKGDLKVHPVSSPICPPIAFPRSLSARSQPSRFKSETRGCNDYCEGWSTSCKLSPAYASVKDAIPFHTGSPQYAEVDEEGRICTSDITEADRCSSSTPKLTSAFFADVKKGVGLHSKLSRRRSKSMEDIYAMPVKSGLSIVARTDVYDQRTVESSTVWHDPSRNFSHRDPLSTVFTPKGYISHSSAPLDVPWNQATSQGFENSQKKSVTVLELKGNTSLLVAKSKSSNKRLSDENDSHQELSGFSKKLKSNSPDKNAVQQRCSGEQSLLFGQTLLKPSPKYSILTGSLNPTTRSKQGTEKSKNAAADQSIIEIQCLEESPKFPRRRLKRRSSSFSTTPGKGLTFGKSSKILSASPRRVSFAKDVIDTEGKSKFRKSSSRCVRGGKSAHFTKQTQERRQFEHFLSSHESPPKKFGKDQSKVTSPPKTSPGSGPTKHVLDSISSSTPTRSKSKFGEGRGGSLFNREIGKCNQNMCSDHYDEVPGEKLEVRATDSASSPQRSKVLSQPLKLIAKISEKTTCVHTVSDNEEHSHDTETINTNSESSFKTKDVDNKNEVVSQQNMSDLDVNVKVDDRDAFGILKLEDSPGSRGKSFESISSSSTVIRPHKSENRPEMVREKEISQAENSTVYLETSDLVTKKLKAEIREPLTTKSHDRCITPIPAIATSQEIVYDVPRKGCIKAKDVSQFETLDHSERNGHMINETSSKTFTFPFKPISFSSKNIPFTTAEKGDTLVYPNIGSKLLNSCDKNCERANALDSLPLAEANYHQPVYSKQFNIDNLGKTVESSGQILSERKIQDNWNNADHRDNASYNEKSNKTECPSQFSSVKTHIFEQAQRGENDGMNGRDINGHSLEADFSVSSLSSGHNMISKSDGLHVDCMSDCSHKTNTSGDSMFGPAMKEKGSTFVLVKYKSGSSNPKNRPISEDVIKKSPGDIFMTCPNSVENLILKNDDGISVKSEKSQPYIKEDDKSNCSEQNVTIDSDCQLKRFASMRASPKVEENDCWITERRRRSKGKLKNSFHSPKNKPKISQSSPKDSEKVRDEETIVTMNSEITNSVDSCNKINHNTTPVDVEKSSILASQPFRNIQFDHQKCSESIDKSISSPTTDKKMLRSVSIKSKPSVFPKPTKASIAAQKRVNISKSVKGVHSNTESKSRRSNGSKENFTNCVKDDNKDTIPKESSQLQTKTLTNQKASQLIGHLNKSKEIVSKHTASPITVLPEQKSGRFPHGKGVIGNFKENKTVIKRRTSSGRRSSGVIETTMPCFSERRNFFQHFQGLANKGQTYSKPAQARRKFLPQHVGLSVEKYEAREENMKSLEVQRELAISPNSEMKI